MTFDGYLVYTNIWDKFLYGLMDQKISDTSSASSDNNLREISSNWCDVDFRNGSIDAKDWKSLNM